MTFDDPCNFYLHGLFLHKNSKISIYCYICIKDKNMLALYILKIST